MSRLREPVTEKLTQIGTDLADTAARMTKF